ncbi:hypothetical protein Q5P01_011903 [Channa striata]|uniref:PH domain-containing protein n=1 Tax=Channa striata TaxID=64152 RepID=A0AA88SMB3_CHASR|nr:hypothetical protein Q5P01_011903 [Channa striata]
MASSAHFSASRPAEFQSWRRRRHQQHEGSVELCVSVERTYSSFIQNASQISMETGEKITGSGLKRQRSPLSDAGDNICSQSEGNDGQKRRCLEAAGQENHSPKPSTSAHLAELGTKLDPPIFSSVRPRIPQLSQKREGGTPPAQRCLSDPGADRPSSAIHDKGFREQLLDEGEFIQRLERFKAPVFQPSPPPGPANPCPRTRSNFVSDIQQKLQCTQTTSSEQASRIRLEREKEFSKLHLQPISENPWLKRSSSDPSLAELRIPPDCCSSSASRVPVSRRKVQWPPMHPWDQVDSDADMTDRSLNEASTSGAKMMSMHTTEASCDSEAPAAVSSELQMEWDQQNTHQDEEVREVTNYKSSVGNEEKHVVSQESNSRAVLALSFSEDQSFSKASLCENQDVSGDEQSFLNSTHSVESNIKETSELSKLSEHSRLEMFSLEDEKIDESYGEEEIEPSTDEESRIWRYPQQNVCTEAESVTVEEQEDVAVKDKDWLVELSRVEKESADSDVDANDHLYVQGDASSLGNVCADISAASKSQHDEGAEEAESECGLDDSLKDQCPFNKEGNHEYHKGCYEETNKDKKNSEESTYEANACQFSQEIQAVNIKGDDIAKILEASQTGCPDVQENTDVAKACTKLLDTNKCDPAADVTEARLSEQFSETEEIEQGAVDDRLGAIDVLREESHNAVARESSKKVTFILEPELINGSSLCETNNSMESETSTSDVELSSHEDTHTAEIIDQMFEEVLEYAGRMDEERGNNKHSEDRDSGIVACSGDKDKMDTESEKEKSEEEGHSKEECDENNGDELLTFPPSGILSPLSKSVEAVVTPLRLATSQESNPPSLLLTPEETSTPPAESAPLYSIDAYRKQRQNKLPTIQSVTPRVQRRAPEKSQTQRTVNTKEKIAALNEETGKLQTVINQTLQALSFCTDEEHGQGSLEEAEAEKLLLVSCEKRSALLAEMARLREERSSELDEAAEEEKDYLSQQPCRGTVTITNIQLPLKVEFVCSSHSRTGRPSHYFFVLIRYGPCNIVATPLATAADAQNGDTISFPTSVTLKDIRSSFEIDVEVYSLSHTSANNSSIERTTTKSRVTPRKLLNTITRSSNSLTSASLPTLNARHSSNFCLVGCHKITLASLGQSKFPLDKVPFLSPLEGNIYLQLHSEGHSNVQHQGFLTMFELISGYGVWHHRYFVLEGCNLYYWNHPNDKETKEAEGSISLSSSPTQCVRPVKRDSCARPFTFELVSNIPNQQDESQETFSKCWFSADSKQERLDWMEKLNQALLDFHTWNRESASRTESQQSNTSGSMRESIL